MIYRFSELRKKWVVDIKRGTILGKVGDLELNGDLNEVTALIVLGRSRLFGFFGKADDFIIKWNDIQIIGEDAVLISAENKTAFNRRNNKTNNESDDDKQEETYTNERQTRRDRR